VQHNLEPIITVGEPVVCESGDWETTRHLLFMCTGLDVPESTIFCEIGSQIRQEIAESISFDQSDEICKRRIVLRKFASEKGS
jgi:hypothetical protein